MRKGYVRLVVVPLGQWANDNITLLETDMSAIWTCAQINEGGYLPDSPSKDRTPIRGDKKTTFHDGCGYLKWNG